MSNASSTQEWLISWEGTKNRSLDSKAGHENQGVSAAVSFETKAEPVWEKRLTWFVILLSCVLLCTTAFFRTWAMSESRRFSFLYDHELKLQEKYGENTKQLRLQLAVLRSPKRIARRAINDLNMRPASLKVMVTRLTPRKSKAGKRTIRIARSNSQGIR